MAVEASEKAVVQAKSPVGETKATVAIANQAGREAPRAGDLGKADPAAHGFASAEHLLGDKAEYKVASAADGRSVWDKINVKMGSPDSDHPGVKPDAAVLAPRQINGDTAYSPLALPGEPTSKVATTNDKEGKAEPEKDGGTTTRKSGELKDGHWSNTKYDYSQTVNKDGQLVSSTMSYDPPKSMTIQDNASGSRQMNVSKAFSFYDTNRSRYVTMLTDDKGATTVLSTQGNGGGTVPYGMIG